MCTYFFSGQRDIVHCISFSFFIDIYAFWMTIFSNIFLIFQSICKRIWPTKLEANLGLKFLRLAFTLTETEDAAADYAESTTEHESCKLYREDVYRGQ